MVLDKILIHRDEDTEYFDGFIQLLREETEAETSTAVIDSYVEDDDLTVSELANILNCNEFDAENFFNNNRAQVFIQESLIPPLEDPLYDEFLADALYTADNPTNINNDDIFEALSILCKYSNNGDVISDNALINFPQKAQSPKQIRKAHALLEESGNQKILKTNDWDKISKFQALASDPNSRSTLIAMLDANNPPYIRYLLIDTLAEKYPDLENLLFNKAKSPYGPSNLAIYHQNVRPVPQWRLIDLFNHEYSDPHLLAQGGLELLTMFDASSIQGYGQTYIGRALSNEACDGVMADKVLAQWSQVDPTTVQDMATSLYLTSDISPRNKTIIIKYLNANPQN